MVLYWHDHASGSMCFYEFHAKTQRNKFHAETQRRIAFYCVLCVSARTIPLCSFVPPCLRGSKLTSFQPLSPSALNRKHFPHLISKPVRLTGPVFSFYFSCASSYSAPLPKTKRPYRNKYNFSGEALLPCERPTLPPP